MADNGKKIVFEGVDRTSQASESAKKGLTSLHDANIKGLKDTNALLKDNISLLEKQRQLITTIASEGLTKPQQAAVGQLTQKLFQTPERVNPEHLRSYSKVLESQMHIGQAGPMSEKLIQKIQELIDTTKVAHKEEINNNNKNTEKTVTEGAKKFLVTEVEKHKEFERIQKLNEQSEKRAGKLVTETVEEQKKPSVFSEVLKANIVTEIGKHLIEKATGIGRGLVGAETGEHFMADIISESIPLLGPIMGQGISRSRQAQFGVEQAQSRLAGRTGRFDKGFSNIHSISEEERFGNIPTAQEFGYGMAETTQAREQFALAGGKAQSVSSVIGALAAEKQFSLARTTTEEQFRLQRLSGDNLDPLHNIAQIMAKMPELKIDSTDLEAVLKVQSGLIEQNSNVIEKASKKDTIEMISRFRGIDSEFFKNPERLAPVIASINQSLQSPGNQFAQARNFAVLSKSMKGADYFDIIEAQAQGIQKQGFLQSTLEAASSEFGGGKSLMTALTGKQFGGGGVLNLAPEVAKSLVTAFEQKPGLFAGFGGSDKDALKLSGYTDKEAADIIGGAKEKVTVREQEMVKAGDAFVMGVTPGMKEIGHQMGESFVNEIKKMDMTVLGVNISNKIAKIIEEKLYHE